MIINSSIHALVRRLLVVGLLLAAQAVPMTRAQGATFLYLPAVQRDPLRLSGDLLAVHTLATAPELLLVELTSGDDLQADGVTAFWFSHDGGGHWQRPATRPWVSAPHVYYATPRATWVASPDGPLLAVAQPQIADGGHFQIVLYTSVDDGVTWEHHPIPVTPTCPEQEGMSLETTPAQPNRLYVQIGCSGVLVAGRGQQWMATSDAGQTWQVVISPDRAGVFQLLSPAQPDRLFVVDPEWRLFRSDDDGVRWTRVGAAPNALLTLTWPDADRLLAGTRYGPLVTVDSGATWRAFTQVPCLLHDDHLAFTIAGPAPCDVLRCADGRLLATPDAGATWSALASEPWSAARALQAFPDQAVTGRTWMISHGGEWDALWRLDPEPGSPWTPVLTVSMPRYL